MCYRKQKLQKKKDTIVVCERPVLELLNLASSKYLRNWCLSWACGHGGKDEGRRNNAPQSTGSLDSCPRPICIAYSLLRNPSSVFLKMWRFFCWLRDDCLGSALPIPEMWFFPRLVSTAHETALLPCLCREPMEMQAPQAHQDFQGPR